MGRLLFDMVILVLVAKKIPWLDRLLSRGGFVFCGTIKMRNREIMALFIHSTPCLIAGGLVVLH